MKSLKYTRPGTEWFALESISFILYTAQINDKRENDITGQITFKVTWNTTFPLEQNNTISKFSVKNTAH